MGNKSSEENYLETILILSGSHPVRAIDIAKELDYTKPSVSVAMKNLRKAGHIKKDEDGYISLTASGRKIAETMYERHIIISDWLIFLGVDKNIAVSDACRMEHDISEQSFSAIKKHIKALRME